MALIIGGLAISQEADRKVTPADNSVVNERDQRSGELTADEQGTSRSDLELTRLIRKNIVSHDKLSSYAHNVKIIATNGVVTLKGPVRSQKEMNLVREIADKTAGSKNVKNEMEIASGE